jgi:hypothetical protein
LTIQGILLAFHPLVLSLWNSTSPEAFTVLSFLQCFSSLLIFGVIVVEKPKDEQHEEEL